jgi:hypothetical protein
VAKHIDHLGGERSGIAALPVVHSRLIRASCRRAVSAA